MDMDLLSQHMARFYDMIVEIAGWRVSCLPICGGSSKNCKVLAFGLCSPCRERCIKCRKYLDSALMKLQVLLFANITGYDIEIRDFKAT